MSIKCHICKEKIKKVFSCENKRHNCVSFNLTSGDLPNQCWQVRHPRDGKNVIQAIPVTSSTGKESSERHTRNVALGEKILNIITGYDEIFRSNKLIDLLNDADGVYSAKLLNRIPGYTDFCDEYQAKRCNIKKASCKSRSPQGKTDSRISLPAMFEDALDSYAKQSQKKRDRKKSTGKKYSKNTTFRKIREARVFLEFLASEDIHDIGSITQHAVDMFGEKYTQSYSARIFTFLKHLEFMMLLKFKIKRPKVKQKTNALELIIEESDFSLAYFQAMKVANIQFELIARLQILYAQQLSKILTLNTSSFESTEDKLLIKLGQFWLPLDKRTSELAKQHLKQFANGIDEKVFNITYQAARRKMKEILNGVDLIRLRASSILNLIKISKMDRVSICKLVGVSIVTIKKYESMLAADIHSEIELKYIISRNEFFKQQIECMYQ